MITYQDVFYIMGRVYYSRGLKERIIMIGNEVDKRAINNMTEGSKLPHKLYKHKYKIEVINTEDPLEVSKLFKDKSVRFLFLDYPKSLEFFNDALKSWDDKIILNGILIFRGTYEDEELEDHPIDQRKIGSFHGIYRTDPPLTIFFKKWGLPYDK